MKLKLKQLGKDPKALKDSDRLELYEGRCEKPVLVVELHPGSGDLRICSPGWDDRVAVLPHRETEIYVRAIAR